MPIQVTCPSCRSRFNVSDKFAGKEGPCPKCKKIIRVPDQSEQVVIHAPESSGPTDMQGRPVLKPIRRHETILSSVQITLIAGCVIGFLLTALIVRMTFGDDIGKFPEWLLYVAAIAMAPPLVYVGYQLLRDQELGAFNVSDLRNRVLICSLIYAVSWFAMPLAWMAFNDIYNMGSWMTALIAMLAVGGAAGMFSFDLDYLLGLVHYGMYLCVCLLGRWIAGLGFLPGMNGEAAKPMTTQQSAMRTEEFWTNLDSWLINGVDLLVTWT